MTEVSRLTSVKLQSEPKTILQAVLISEVHLEVRFDQTMQVWEYSIIFKIFWRFPSPMKSGSKLLFCYTMCQLWFRHNKMNLQTSNQLANAYQVHSTANTKQIGQTKKLHSGFRDHIETKVSWTQKYYKDHLLFQMDRSFACYTNCLQHSMANKYFMLSVLLPK